MLYGRAEERVLIDGLLADAQISRSSVLTIQGEVGIGKSALLNFAVSQAEGMHVLRGLGVESEAELAFAALDQILHPLLKRIDQIPTPQAAALRRALGLSQAEGVVDRFLVALAVLSLLSEEAEERPLLCVVDDAHWLDHASADALTFVGRRLGAEGIVLLFAAREEDPSSFQPGGLPTIRLEGLDDEAARELLAAFTGHQVAPEVARSLVRQTEGNALALKELASTLTAGQLSGHEPLPDQLPLGRNLEQVFLTRVQRLPPGLQTLLLVASAEEAGDLSTISRAARALELDLGALELAESSGLVHMEPSTVRFRHPLVRTAIYQAASLTQRQTVHGALADALEERGEEDRRVWHRAAAASGPNAEAAADLERSADRARGRGGHLAGAAAFKRAAELTSDPAIRARREIAAADSALRGGRPQEASAMLEAIDSTAVDAASRADIEDVRGRIELLSGMPAHAAEILTVGADRVAPVDPKKALYMLFEAREAAVMGGDVPRAIEIGRRAEALSASGDSADRIMLNLTVGAGAVYEGDSERGLPLLREVVELAEKDDEAEASSLAWASAAAQFLGDEELSLALAVRAVARARSVGAVVDLEHMLAFLVQAELSAARFASARAHATEALQLATDTGKPNYGALALGYLAYVAAIQGRELECRERADEAIEEGVARGIPSAVALGRWGRGLLDLATGGPVEAMGHLDALSRGGPEGGSRFYALLSAPDLIEAAARASEPDVGGVALSRLEPWATHAALPWALALLARSRALLSGADQAEEYFLEAVRLHADGKRPFDRARTHLLFGEHLRRERRRVDARPHLRLALETFQRLGAAPWEERARTELRASGESARKREVSTIEQLTPQELQVVRLVVQGASNKEVAAQLFISPRTVDYHLRNVYAKFGLTSRTELNRLDVLQETSGGLAAT